MRRALVLLVPLVVACVPLNQSASPCSPSPNLAIEVYEAVLADRANAGVPPLQWDAALADQAQAWAEEMMRGGFRHSGRASENIAYRWPSCDLTGTDLERQWMASPRHREQILWPHYTRLGVGWAHDGAVWAVQQFH